MKQQFIFTLYLIFLCVSCVQSTADTKSSSPFWVSQTPSGLFLIKMQEEDVFTHDVGREAKLVQDGNCLRMQNESLGESGLAIWQNEIEIIETSGVVHILNVGPAGQIEIGDHVEFGATRITDVSSDEYTEWHGDIPTECRSEPYYIIRDVSILGD